MFKKLAHGLAIGIATAAVFSVILALGLFRNWQGAASDKIFQTRPVRGDIVIVAIDNASIQKIGRWPWDRKVFADALAKIGKGKPSAVGIDVAFLEPQNPESDGALAVAITDLGKVTLAAEAEKGRVLAPIPPLASKARIGMANINPDEDGVTRKVPIKTVAEDQKTYYHFAIETLNSYYESSSVSPNKVEKIPADERFIRVNYAGSPGSFTRYSFSDVLEGSIVPANFTDKIVLIGATAPDLHDEQITPVSNGVAMSGVEIHANVIQTILEGRYLFEETTEATIIAMAIVIIALTAILIYLPILPAIIVTAVTAVVYILYAIFSFDNGIIRNIIVPPLAILVTGAINIVYKYFSESRQKKFIKKAFSYYLSSEVLSEVLSSPEKLKLGGTRTEISVLFSDIAGFTSISEKINPEDLVHILNSYLTRMTKIVFENRGVLDKYIGDAVMAFWGAPLKTKNHALLACKTALEMYQEMDAVRQEWKEYGVADFDIRIGVNSGEMAVGNMGSDARFDYTLLGDNVNLGSRLEGINKEYGTNIIISESTYAAVKDNIVARKLDTVAVKGKKTGVVIYELRGLAPASAEETKFLRYFEAARVEYEKGLFSPALRAFQALSKKYPNDNPTKVYIERLKLIVKNPPKDWDGIFKATTK